MALRVGVGLVAAAVTWAGAVVLAAPDPVGPPPTSVTLVAFEPPTFPLSLDPVPAGLVPSSLSAGPGGVLHGGYRSTDGEDRVSLLVTPEEPEQHGVEDTVDVSVRGRDAELVTGSDVVCGGSGTECVDVRVPYVHVVVEWRDGTWVQLSGDGRYEDADRLLAVAETLVDQPRRVPLQVHLAPSGWVVEAYKDDRVLTLANADFPQQTLTVHLPEAAIPAEELVGQLMGPVGPLVSVTVGGRPAQLVPTDSGWYLQAQFPDGTTFVLQAPEAFTQEQVLAVAAQVTYTP